LNSLNTRNKIFGPVLLMRSLR